MQCPGCQSENSDDARFCSQCGRKLERECPACGTSISPSVRFCNQCGASLDKETREDVAPHRYTPEHLARRILESRTAVEGERKQVTIVFADIKGSTDLVRDLDPEDASRLLEPALQSMMAAVHRYEGTVNRVQGDGLMAMFGAPLAHEDHALRACHAALDMQLAARERMPERESDPTLELRVGLHSGEVVVRAINNDLSMNYDAMGLTAHLASRMEQLASPNSIRLTADTMHLVQGFVETEALGATTVKGLTDPLEVFELQGVTGARTASRLHRSETSHPIPAAIRSSRSLRIVLPRQRRVTDALCSSMVRPASESHDCYWNFAGASAARLPGSRGTRSPLVSRWRFIPWLTSCGGTFVSMRRTTKPR